MTNKEYMWPGIAAIALAILFPLYWSHAITFGDFSLPAAVSGELVLSTADWLFLIVGVLIVYVYFALKRVLNDHQNYQGIDILILMAIAVTSLYYGGLLLLDAISALNLGESTKNMLLSTTYIFVGIGNFLFGLLDILIGIVLLKDSSQLPSLVKAFAIAMLINGLAAITFIFSILVIAVYPIALVILAIYFLKKPEMIEVV